jgi:hypothetical protein
MKTAADLASSLSRLAEKSSTCPEGELTVHEVAVVQSALQTLAGLVGSLAWRLNEEAQARARALASAQAAAAAQADALATPATAPTPAPQS